MKAEFVVGHSPRRLLSRTVWHFLRHCGKATCTCEVTWRRKFGNGLEVPCLYSIKFRLSRVPLSLCLARMLIVEVTLLERSEWIRSFCHLGSPTDRYRNENGKARGELRSHSSRVRVFNTCNTRMRLFRTT